MPSAASTHGTHAARLPCAAPHRTQTLHTAPPATRRLARDQLRNYAPTSTSLKVVDWCQLVLYTVAYITSILCTPIDDELKYESDRNPLFYKLTFSSGFKKQLSTWHGLNVVRTICSGIGWLLVGAEGACTQPVLPAHAAWVRVCMQRECMACMLELHA